MNIKTFIVSCMAFQDTPNTGAGATTIVMHKPAIIPGQTMDEAAQKAREKMFANWPPSDGWYSHQAAIMPVTKEFMKLAIAAKDEGSIDESGEDGETFGRVYKFDGQTETDEQSEVIM